MQKACFKCGIVKPIEDFYKHTGMSDGRLGKCKECTKSDSKKRYDEDPEKIKEYEKKRGQTEHRRNKRAEYQRKGRAIDPSRYNGYNKTDAVKYAAHYLTSNAIRDGRLVRQPCEICGKPRSEAHHSDYLKPLEVTWLCRKHHLEAHGKKCYTDTGEV